jgi:hypothetical protein
MLNVAEWIFSTFLVSNIVTFGVAYALGYSNCRKRVTSQAYQNSRADYLYHKGGDTL